MNVVYLLEFHWYHGLACGKSDVVISLVSMMSLTCYSPNFKRRLCNKNQPSDIRALERNIHKQLSSAVFQSMNTPYRSWYTMDVVLYNKLCNFTDLLCRSLEKYCCHNVCQHRPKHAQKELIF